MKRPILIGITNKTLDTYGKIAMSISTVYLGFLCGACIVKILALTPFILKTLNTLMEM